MSVRRATEADLPRLIELMAQARWCWRSSRTSRGRARRTRSSRTWSYEAARGKRHGEALMEHAIAEARRAGCYKVSLTSNKRRSDAHRFYERLGFVQTHEAFRIDL